MGVGSRQISRQVLFLPLMTETSTALRDLGVKIISRTTARPAAMSAEASAFTPYHDAILP
jgi:hypothetical protein